MSEALCVYDDVLDCDAVSEGVCEIVAAWQYEDVEGRVMRASSVN